MDVLAGGARQAHTTAYPMSPSHTHVSPQLDAFGCCGSHEHVKHAARAL